MAFDTRKALDVMNPTQQAIKAARSPDQPLDQTREEILGYEFKPGEFVKDKVSDQTVKVLAAERGDFVTSAAETEKAI